MNEYQYMVYVQCMTYNQAQFIVDAMNGFCMQETSFQYVCVIVDDCSTDGEQEIITHYMNEQFDMSNKAVVRKEEEDDYTLVFAQHKSNTNCFFCVLFLKYNHYGKKSKISYIREWRSLSKYSATCEGDDYWTSPMKLQKQVDFLEGHPEYVLTCHRYSIYDQEEGRFEDDGNDDLFKGGEGFMFGQKIQWITKTLTLVFRTEAVEEYDEKYAGIRRDTVLVYILLKYGLGYYFNENMGVYRRSLNGICGKKDKATNSLARLRVRRDIYLYDKNAFTRQAYYRFFFQAFFIAPGKALKEMAVTVSDIFYLPYYFLKEILRLCLKLFSR